MVSIAHILCPTDLSDVSMHAVEQAIAVARWYRARITAQHVYPPPFAPIPGLPAPAERVSDAELERVRLETARAFQGARDAGVEVDVAIDVGRPAAQILRRAAESGADLLVIGTHGASGVERLVLGSVSERVLRRATCPVLTVPPRGQATVSRPFTRVLCAVDFSEWSLAALEYAFSLAREAKAELTIVHVLEWPWAEPPAPSFEALPPDQAAALREYRRYCEQRAMARLESLVEEPAQVAGPLTIRVSHGKPYVEILRAAEESQADLIVVGVHGRSALDLSFLGSTANQVVRRAQCPVLTLRR
jgi:nucleotide-binding universal stress UspA family protein